jgi:hypothetical protein
MLYMTGGSIPGRGRDFSLCHYIQTGSGSRVPSYPVGTSSSFPGVKQPECEGDHLPLSNAEVKNMWSCMSSCHSGGI